MPWVFTVQKLGEGACVIRSGTQGANVFICPKIAHVFLTFNALVNPVGSDRNAEARLASTTSTALIRIERCIMLPATLAECLGSKSGFMVSLESLLCWQIALATDGHPGLVHVAWIASSNVAASAMRH